MYIVRCSDDTLYTGWTNHLAERIEAHNRGKGARYTRSRRPVELVYFESFATKEEAMSREFKVKKLTRAEKLRMITAGSLIGDGSAENVHICSESRTPGRS